MSVLMVCGLDERERSSNMIRSCHQSTLMPAVKKGRDAGMIDCQGFFGFQSKGGGVEPSMIDWRMRSHCSERIYSSKHTMVPQSFGKE